MSLSEGCQQDELVALDAVLASRTFSKCQNLAKLLHYLCQKCHDGCASELKEYNIGVEALGRAADFDPTTNSVVRVEFHRLREKLKKYYETEGMADPVAISLQPGNYVPQFVRREAGPLVAVPQETPPAASRPERRLLPVPAAANGSALAPAKSARPAWRGSAALYLAVIAGLAVAITVLVLYVRTPTQPVTSAAAGFSAGTPSAAAADSGAKAVRILAGYSKERYIDRAGRVWQGDRYFSGGQAVTLPREYFARTLDPTLFETLRAGDFSYNIPLAPGDYELRLYFSETGFGPDTISGGGEASRMFSVLLNGKPVLNNFDILSDAAGQNVADVRVFKDVAPATDGRLHLQFQRNLSDPILNAIEIEPASPGRMNPVRIVAQADSFTDREGRLWNPDCYFEGGRLVERRAAVANTSNPGLYYGERFGHFNYAIPVAAGKYRVTLYFAETYFGPNNPGSGGARSRLFDIDCNGVALVRGLDVFKQSGGPDRALERTFRGLQPNAQGKLIFRFVPVENYACLNAIKVVDESQ
ncbi:MAG TPA: malectin domain-containing carbohydrate-binding protein [Terriglobia bacterium]|nr:malectin domain-containing carbohydrate-binding protein [Terriglobia bacterium]